MELGDRAKQYEAMYEQKLMPQVPAVIRLDGRSFHTYTKLFNRPFDSRLMKAMNFAVEALLKETNAVAAYTQSDEITLILKDEKYNSQKYFNGKVNKINSVLASICTTTFNYLIHYDNPYMGDASFDCRCFSVPNRVEACNMLIWREQDAIRNSIQMFGQANYSHKELQGKSCSKIQDMLMDKGINWNDQPQDKKRGTLYLKSEEGYFVSDYPDLTKIANIADVIFENEVPIMKEDVRA